MLIHVLTHRFGAILFVEVLQVHAVHPLGRVAARGLQGVHLARVHLRMIWVERPGVVAHHLLAHSSGSLNMGLLAIFGHHQVLRHVVRSCAASQVYRVIRFLAGSSGNNIASKFELLLIS